MQDLDRGHLPLYVTLLVSLLVGHWEVIIQMVFSPLRTNGPRFFHGLNLNLDILTSTASICRERPITGDQPRGSMTFSQVAPPSLVRRTNVVELRSQIIRPSETFVKIIG